VGSHRRGAGRRGRDRRGRAAGPARAAIPGHGAHGRPRRRARLPLGRRAGRRASRYVAACWASGRSRPSAPPPSSGGRTATTARSSRPSAGPCRPPCTTCARCRPAGRR
jgi:hypothetical protein